MPALPTRRVLGGSFRGSMLLETGKHTRPKEPLCLFYCLMFCSRHNLRPNLIFLALLHTPQKYSRKLCKSCIPRNLLYCTSSDEQHSAIAYFIVYCGQLAMVNHICCLSMSGLITASLPIFGDGWPSGEGQAGKSVSEPAVTPKSFPGRELPLAPL